MEPIKKLNHHYSMENPASIFDEEAMTALELAGRTTHKVNEVVELVNGMVPAVNEAVDSVGAAIQKGNEAIDEAIEGIDPKLPGIVNEWFENHPADVTRLPEGSIDETKFTEETIEAYKNKPIEDGSIDENKLSEDVVKGFKNHYLTPQMFGAAGDGVTDDTDAMLAMLAHAHSLAPSRAYPYEDTVKDYSCIDLRFSGKYLINAPMVFNYTYGVKLHGLNLIAGADFTGDAMVIFKGCTRGVSISDTKIDANEYANTCIKVQNYTLNFDLNNVELTRFRSYGLQALDKGHEMKFNNVKVWQIDWGESDKLNTLFNEGTGIYLDTERHDNHFTNVIVNYCHTAGFDINSSANTLVNCHFYGGTIYNRGAHNHFQNCYFDCTLFYTAGFMQVTNCFFNRSSDAVTPFMYLTEEAANAWRYDTASITGCTFRKTGGEYATAIGYGDLGKLPEMNTYGNTFYYVTPFVSKTTKGNAPTPWEPPAKVEGSSSAGYVLIGDIYFIWGSFEGSEGFITYPDGITLSETLNIHLQRTSNNHDYIPFPNSIQNNRFWINSVAGGTVDWLVIGKK